MCNDFKLETDIAAILAELEEMRFRIELPEGKPNVPSREDIRMTDMAPIIRTGVPGDRNAADLVNRRWSWPGAQGKPVYNYRSEGRQFRSHRCLVLTDGFYEFTDPEVHGQKRLDKWLFTLKDYTWFCMAGIWRDSLEGEAFTLLTMLAGEDIAPYHHRQIIPLPRERWADWLDPTIPSSEVLTHLPAGSLPAVRVFPTPGEEAQGAFDL